MILDKLHILSDLLPGAQIERWGRLATVWGTFNPRNSSDSDTPLRGQPELAQAIFPGPCTFLSRDLPLCSVIRPHSTKRAGAVATATALVESGLFDGQSQAFFDAVVALAQAADAAIREG